MTGVGPGQRPAPPTHRRLPRWAWVALAIGVVAAAYGGLTALEARRTARLRDALPAPDLTQIEPRVAAAITVHRQAAHDAPRSAERWGELGAVFDVHGLFDAAETCYATARSLDAEDFRWPYLLAIVRDVNGAEGDEVERLFLDATQLREDYAPAWFRLGHALSLRGAQASARDALERAVAVDPELALAHRELGQVLLALDDDAAALESLRRAAELNPRDGSVWSALAQALARAGRQQEAQRAASAARRLPPSTALRDPVHGQFVAARGVSTVQLLERAGAQIEGRAFQRALATLRPLLADSPRDAQVQYLVGSAQARLGDTRAATEHFDAALDSDPAHVGALLESGALLERERRPLAALERYRRAQEAAPSDPEVLASLARAYAVSRDDFAADRAFARWAEVADLDARSLMNWGNALERLGRSAEAVERYRAALGLEPDYAHAHYNLAVALEASGQREEAIRHYRSAQRLDPELPAGRALSRLGVAP